MSGLRLARRAFDAWRAALRDREAARELDPHALRDLGLAASEVGSYGAEADGLVERTRRRIALRALLRGVGGRATEA